MSLEINILKKSFQGIQDLTFMTHTNCLKWVLLTQYNWSFEDDILLIAAYYGET